MITNDGRNIIGNLRGFDQVTNLVLDECHERIFSPDRGVEQEVLGLYVIRGDNMYVKKTNIANNLSPWRNPNLILVWNANVYVYVSINIHCLSQCCDWRA